MRVKVFVSLDDHDDAADDDDDDDVSAEAVEENDCIIYIHVNMEIRTYRIGQNNKGPRMEPCGTTSELLR